jgi:hypothetical protein
LAEKAYLWLSVDICGYSTTENLICGYLWLSVVIHLAVKAYLWLFVVIRGYLWLFKAKKNPSLP